MAGCWLGAPSKHNFSTRDGCDPYTSRIGGIASALRQPSDDFLICPKCKKADNVALIAQLYAPLGEDDRVLYCFVCSKCSTKEASAVFVWRSQCPNPDLWEKKVAAAAAPKVEEPATKLFDEHDDWGDSDGDDSPQLNVAANETPKAETEPAVPVVSIPAEPPVTGCGSGVVLDTSKTFPAAHLDIFEEPVQAEDKRSAAEQLEDLVKDLGDEVVEFADDGELAASEAAEETAQQEYFDSLAAVPTQVIRWHPGGRPLLSINGVPPQPPACSVCGGPRQFEFQLMSPLIYFLTKGHAEDDHPLHFSTILVYTCANGCMDKPVSKEFCTVMDEI